MTTAAPPEKMTLEPCGCGGAPRLEEFSARKARFGIACGECHIRTNLGERDEVSAAWNNAMSAARRLSAPAAPRVGDDVRVRIMEMIRHDYEPPELIADAIIDLFAALSAPPAASADEREELGTVIARGAAFEQALLLAQTDPREMARAYIAKCNEVLGYRKLAPAQSVGQSAAQGVERNATLKEIAKWCEFMSNCAYTVSKQLKKDGLHDKAELSWMEGSSYAGAAANCRSRLSALPKGQEYER